MEETLSRLQASPHPHVKVGVTDIDGVLRTKYLSKEKVIAGLREGIGFCNVVFQWDSGDALYGNGLAEPAFGDAPATIDAATYRELPWEDNLPFLLADFRAAPSASVAAACPRRLLAEVVRHAEDLGFTARFGPEYEWFAYYESPDSIDDKNGQPLNHVSPGMFGYSGLRTGHRSHYFQDLFTQLAAFDVHLEGLHTETGPGALEAAITHQPALEAADRALLFKQGVKQISYRHGLMASFMAKADADLPGCGGHLHQSLWWEDRNVFYDADRPHGMSRVFEHYLAGQLALLPALLPMYAPTVNSYKRYVPGSWAATRANWGVDNRTVALRVIPGSMKSTRLEMRVPGADANPYLAMAACLASGLYGVENKLELPHPAVEGSAYEQSVGTILAPDLGKAVDGARSAPAFPSSIAPAFSAHFMQTREWEWQQFRRAVTDWERKRYFELV